MSLKRKTFSGLLWTFIDTFLLKGLSFIATIVLARLLGPAEFGLIGMIAVFIAIGISMVESGMSASLIRVRDATNADYSTVFYLNIIASCIIYCIFFLTAPFIADFYDQQVLTVIIRVYCLSFVFSAFSNVQLAILTRHMQFKKIMLLNLPGTLLGVVVGLILGYQGFGVWSIVMMYLTTQLVLSILLWIFSDWHPTRVFSKEKMNLHFNFGYKLMLSGLLDTIFKNIYNIVIGKFFSVQSLGFYDRSNTLAEYPVSTITGIINKVSYPLLATLQDDNVKISAVYKQLLQFTFFITAPLMLGAAAIGRPLFLLVLGDQWLPAVMFFQIICFASMLYPIHAFNINVLKVYGRSDLYLKLEIAKKILTVICVVIAFPFGLVAIVWTTVVVSFLALVINTMFSSKMIHYTMLQQFRDMTPVFIISGLTFLLMSYMLSVLENFSMYLQLLIPILCGIVFYILINILFKTKGINLIVDLIKDRKSLKQ